MQRQKEDVAAEMQETVFRPALWGAYLDPEKQGLWNLYVYSIKKPKPLLELQKDTSKTFDVVFSHI